MIRTGGGGKPMSAHTEYPCLSTVSLQSVRGEREECGPGLAEKATVSGQVFTEDTQEAPRLGRLSTGKTLEHQKNG